MARRNFTHRGVLAATTMVLALFAGCSVGPDYVRPALKPPGNYKEIDGWQMAQPKDNVIRGPWWEIFNELELNALEEQVDVSNQNIVAAEAPPAPTLVLRANSLSIAPGHVPAAS